MVFVIDATANSCGPSTGVEPESLSFWATVPHAIEDPGTETARSEQRCLRDSDWCARIPLLSVSKSRFFAEPHRLGPARLVIELCRVAGAGEFVGKVLEMTGNVEDRGGDCVIGLDLCASQAGGCVPGVTLWTYRELSDGEERARIATITAARP